MSRNQKTIAILNPKGGCGKTTLSINLAHALYEQGNSVLLVDTDRQGSARDWHAAREDNPLTFVSLDRPGGFTQNLERLAGNHDYIFLDGAAKLEDMLAETIKAAGCILIPVQPSPLDIWAASDLVELIKTRQSITGGIPKAACVVNCAKKNTTLGRDVLEALKEYGLPVAEPAIVDRQVYPRAAATGETVFASKNKDAISEMTALAQWVIDFIDSERKG